jgi:hypothetical protein
LFAFTRSAKIDGILVLGAASVAGGSAMPKDPQIEVMAKQAKRIAAYLAMRYDVFMRWLFGG